MPASLNLLDALTVRLGDDHAHAAINVIATWARSQAAIAEQVAPSSNQPWAQKSNVRVYRQVARLMEAYGATPPAADRSMLAAAVWCALADGGHTAAADSPTGDGYEVGRIPDGAVLVTLVRGTGLTGTPWAATQRQTLQPWADTLTAAGYQPEIVGALDAPAALRISPRDEEVASRG